MANDRTKSTRIYGASDDLLEFEGGYNGETGCYGTDEEGASGIFCVCSDGTMFIAKYGKLGQGIWGLELLQKGKLFESHEPCMDADADPYSDVITLKPGITWVYAATTWEKVM